MNYRGFPQALPKNIHNIILKNTNNNSKTEDFSFTNESIIINNLITIQGDNLDYLKNQVRDYINAYYPAFDNDLEKEENKFEQYIDLLSKIDHVDNIDKRRMVNVPDDLIFDIISLINKLFYVINMDNQLTE